MAATGTHMASTVATSLTGTVHVQVSEEICICVVQTYMLYVHCVFVC